jgi:hypothetical protein
MAVTSIRTTYALDLETVRTLEKMAQRWDVSKSEALRRAIRFAADQDLSGSASALAALDALQDSLDLSASQTRRWSERTRRERRSSSFRLEQRSL